MPSTTNTSENKKLKREEKLREKIVAQLVAINLNRTELLEKAHAEGGIAKVIEFENCYNALQDAYYET